MFKVTVESAVANYDGGDPVFLHHESTDPKHYTGSARKPVKFSTFTDSEAVAKDLAKVFSSVFGENAVTIVTVEDVK